MIIFVPQIKIRPYDRSVKRTKHYTAYERHNTKWKLVILLDALLFLSNMTFAKDTINQYTEGNPIDTTAVSISDKTNFPDRLYVDSLSLKRHFIHRIGIEARPGYIFPTSSFSEEKI